MKLLAELGLWEQDADPGGVIGIPEGFGIKDDI